MRSSTELHDDLTVGGAAHKIVHPPSSSGTARLAAGALGIPAGEVVKPRLSVLDDERPIPALVTGDATVDADALAHAEGATQIRSADFEALVGPRRLQLAARR